MDEGQDEHDEQTWAIWALARQVENEWYSGAAKIAHSFPDFLLREAKTSLQFMLDIIGQEERTRKEDGG